MKKIIIWIAFILSLATVLQFLTATTTAILFHEFLSVEESLMLFNTKSTLWVILWGHGLYYLEHYRPETLTHVYGVTSMVALLLFAKILFSKIRAVRILKELRLQEAELKQWIEDEEAVLKREPNDSVLSEFGIKMSASAAIADFSNHLSKMQHQIWSLEYDLNYSMIFLISW